MPMTRSERRKLESESDCRDEGKDKESKGEGEQKTPKNKKKKEPQVPKGWDTFPDRLTYNSRIYGIPVTSTPKSVKESVVVTAKDIETCFGFDTDNEEENYEATISPIFGRRLPLPFLQGQARLTVESKQTPVLQPFNVNGEIVTNVESEQGKIDDRTAKGVVVPSSSKECVKEKKTMLKRSKKQSGDQKSKAVSKKAKLKEWLLFELDELANVDEREIEVPEARIEEDVKDVFVKRDAGRKGFNALLAKYKHDDEDDGLQVHFDSDKIKKTYSPKTARARDYMVFRTNSKQSRKSGRKSSQKRTPCSSKNPSNHISEEESSDSDGLDPAAKQWLDEKQKEFEDVQHVPLLMTKGTPDSHKGQ